MKFEILTDLLYLLSFLYWLHLESKYMWPVKIATFVATIYLKGFIVHTNNLINPCVSQINLGILDQALHEENSNIFA
jgi:hypothetical protein